LDPHTFARDKVICFFDGDVGNICERLNNAHKDAVPENLIEDILSLHDLKKSAAHLRRFLLREFPGEYPGEYGPLVTQETQVGAEGSRKCPKDPPRDPPSRQVSDSQKKSLPSSQSA
jgi:hypothetical protein